MHTISTHLLIMAFTGAVVFGATLSPFLLHAIFGPMGCPAFAFGEHKTQSQRMGHLLAPL